MKNIDQFSFIFSHRKIIFLVVTIVIFIISLLCQAFANALTAIGTVSAVIWALYHQGIKDYFERPVLSIKEVSFEPPYFRQADEEKNGVKKGVGYYVNIPLENIGKRVAKNCQPILNSMGYYQDNAWKKEKNWVPIPLSWAADEEVFFSGRPREERNLIPFRPYLFNLGKLSTQHPEEFNILTIIFLHAQPSKLGPGYYGFEVMVTAEDTEPITKYFIVNWQGGCTDNFQEVLKKITISAQNQPLWGNSL